MPTIDHLGIYTPPSTFKTMTTFYTKILLPLGITKVVDEPNLVGFGNHGDPEFEIFSDDEAGEASNGSSISSTQSPTTNTATTAKATSTSQRRQRLHFAFIAPTRNSVHAFYDAGMREGAVSVGEPGPRPNYAPTYYAAFMKDPVGNGIEAVCLKEGE